MCIVLLTTAHPDYALIMIDNRDEFILRPTSRPHWWKTLPKPVATGPPVSLSTPSSASASTFVSEANSTAPSSSVNSAAPTPLSSSPARETFDYHHSPQPQGPSPLSNVALPRELDIPKVNASSNGSDASANGDEKPEPKTISVLSSRDLQRAERGTWLGITKGGNFAVLTNYREMDTHDAAHPIHAARSRGGMVTAWMAAAPEMSLDQFVEEMLRDGGVKGVGGFSLMCGKLRKEKSKGEGEPKNMEPLAIISNRYDCADQVPRIGKNRGETLGLSNTCFGDTEVWPKIANGEKMLRHLVEEEAEKKDQQQGMSEDELVKGLFGILDKDTLPRDPSWGFEEYIMSLKKSVFIPPIGDKRHLAEMEDIRASAPKEEELGEDGLGFEEPSTEAESKVDNMQGFATGLYGTQRQTVLLVDWEGNVRFTERALWDAWGRKVPRGKGDKTFRFRVEGWDGEDDAADGKECK
ncbi:uncharacterized protein MKZ38_003034 [Zalerion maritima]|uniref:DUF833-domain-containing protein n=1 Tax=Zalerion maritima TaxID=339359 RepID=A0AAD5RN35_9PEZI|nr:uncharacterized protein MKZ38_003034 [Zalerion maritima]